MAEAILRHRLEELGIDHVEVDSAGTGAWHAGESADPRTLRTLRSRGIEHHGRARQLTARDFSDFDLILTMDSQNLRDTLNWRGADPARVRRFLDRDVPDPYYDHDHGFERVFEMLDEGCRRLIADLQAS
jgi:protein-tyrosine phosphatase